MAEKQETEEKYKKCSICHKRTNTKTDTILFGDWMQNKDITVHYFCLLFSTNLQQRGVDQSGILGFLLNDIRVEAQKSNKRICYYCNENHASVQCVKCREYMHFVCGVDNDVLYHFKGAFDAYCHRCLPVEDYPKELEYIAADNPKCSICKEQMGIFKVFKWIYADCCGKGFAHQVCVQGFALNAGYYLRCIWCGSPNFREFVRRLGVFVPDRDAQWELERGRYRDLHRGHKRCDVENCRCPRGRTFYNGKKWEITLCSLCGSYGVHNPGCMPISSHRKNDDPKYKCPTCSVTETQLALSQTTVAQINPMEDNASMSIHMRKDNANSAAYEIHETPYFSEESNSSFVTVVERQSVVPTTVVDPSKLAAAVALPEPDAAVALPEPDAAVALPELAAAVALPEPASAVASPEPAAAVASPEPASTIALPEAAASVASPEPASKIALPEPAASVASPEPPGNVKEGPLKLYVNYIETKVWMYFRDVHAVFLCKVRLDKNDPRFQGKTLGQIIAEGKIKEKDAVEVLDDGGVFQLLDKIIDEHLAGVEFGEPADDSSANPS